MISVFLNLTSIDIFYFLEYNFIFIQIFLSFYAQKLEISINLCSKFQKLLIYTWNSDPKFPIICIFFHSSSIIFLYSILFYVLKTGNLYEFNLLDLDPTNYILKPGSSNVKNTHIFPVLKYKFIIYLIIFIFYVLEPETSRNVSIEIWRIR